MHRKVIIPLLMLALTACGPAETGTPAAGTPGVAPYRTPTPTLTITPLPPLTQVFLPTPTPMTYAIRSGDTLSAIAGRFNVSLDALRAANPEIDPAVLPIGTVLVIPVGDVVAGEPSPTPAALPVRQVHCYPETGGGLWCLGLVENEHGATIENISAQFTLLDASGDVAASQVVSGMINILPAGGSMPLAAHFTAPLPAVLTPRLQVLTSILLQPGDGRYLPVSLQNVLVLVQASGLEAQVSGQVMPLMLDGQATTLWILGTAYDAAGNVIGVRRWEAEDPLPGGVLLDFSFSVYSLGPAIERVDLLVEARP